jgi:type IV pilus assembly protein PilM
VVLAGVRDRLAPLQSWLFPRRVYLQLEDQALVAMVLEAERLVWHERVPLPQGVCENGAPVAVEALGDLLGDWLIERGYPGAHVKAVLPRAATAWRVIEWPDGQWPEAPELVVRQQQGELDLPWSLQDADLWIEPLLGDPPRSLLLAVQRQLLEAWIEVCSQAGIALDGLEALPICLWRAVKPQLEDGVQVVLQLDDQQSWLLALEQGQPLGEWPCPPAGELLEAPLRRWAQRYSPSAGLLIGSESMVQTWLPQLTAWLGCPVTPFAPGAGTAALWGLAAGERQP